MMKCVHPEVVKFHEYGGCATSPLSSPMLHFLVVELKDGTKKEFGGVEGGLPFMEADDFLKKLDKNS
jgi:hypothetical protein